MRLLSVWFIEFLFFLYTGKATPSFETTACPTDADARV